MQKIKCAIIGCGRISYKHVEGIANNDSEMELVAVCDIIEERAIEKRDEYLERFPDRDVKVYTDYKKMLEEVDIDMCSISTESGYHGEIALYCLEQSKHVLIEKPMAMSLEEIDKINKLADEKGLKVGV